MKKSISILSLLLSVFLITSCDYKGREEIEIKSGWRISNQDSMSFAKADFDDSDWKIYDYKTVKTGKINSYFWLRQTVEVPANLSAEDLWICLSRFNAAVAVYADGIYIGSRGKLPPDANIRNELQAMIKIPSNCLHNNRVTLALRFFSPQTQTTNIDIRLGNSIQAAYVNDFRCNVNQHIFTAMALLCLFISFYCFSQYFIDRSNRFYIFFGLSILFITFYFYDLGATVLFCEYNLQRSLVRPCLPISINFILLYLADFFKQKHIKMWGTIVCVVDILFLTLYQIAKGNGALTDTLFLISLVDIFAIVVYGMVVTIKGLIRKVQGSLPVFLGFIVASVLAAYDIVYMVNSKQPFMWLQSFAFFALDLAIFITITLKTASMTRQMEKFAKESSYQRDKLSAMFDSAKKISNETTNIVNALQSSVVEVTKASENSSEKVLVISDAITKQEAIRAEVASSIEQFTRSLESMSRQLEEEAVSINETAKDTNAIVEGIQAVGSGITTAASFANTLLDLTKTGATNMKQLTQTMNDVQASSKEILQVAAALEEFAQQTDLLAMNASIEAAHAGESGKGFAVIAHEIKSLASQSSQRSSKIGEIVVSINHAVQASVDLSAKVAEALNDIQSGAIKSAQETEKAANGMAIQQSSCLKISKESKSLTENSMRVQKEAEGQTEFSNKLVESMKALKKASEEVDSANKEIEEGSKALETQSKSLLEIVEHTKMTSQKLEDLMNA